MHQNHRWAKSIAGGWHNVVSVQDTTDAKIASQFIT